VEEVMIIPESRRSSAQQRILVEYENAQRVAQRDAARQASVNAARAKASQAIRSSLWDQRERYLQTVAHTEGAQVFRDEAVIHSAAFISWQDWQNLSSESLAEINASVDAYFAANGLS
jgi:hypothetical protein